MCAKLNVSIPQAVWIACNERRQTINSIEDEFQYRKRYGLHAILTTSERELFSSCFNTASGMDCMQSGIAYLLFALSRFQYRKRYGLHAIWRARLRGTVRFRFNTASGMDCMQ